MPLQSALQFIEHVRSHKHLQARLDHLNTHDLPGLIAFAAELGYEITVEELRLGFKHDWVARWLRYRPS